jgi:hypothetical protein
MGAYANPQEIEGQFDATQNQRNYQHMFDTITSSAQKNSERLAEIQTTASKKNEAMIAKRLQEKGATLSTIAREEATNTTGFNFDYLNKGVELNAYLSAQPVLTPEQRRQLENTSAIPHVIHDQLAITVPFQQQIDKTLAIPEGSPGAIDRDITDPKVLAAGIALGKKDGKAAYFGSYKDGKGEEDYLNTTIYLNPTEELPEGGAVSLKALKIAWEGKGDIGVTYVPNPDTWVTKIQNQNAVKPDGSGIFVMKDDTWTNEINKAYLNTSNIIGHKPLGTSAKGGDIRMDMVEVNKGEIEKIIKLNAQTVVAGNKEMINQLPSWYNNFTMKALKKQEESNGKSFNGNRDLKDYEQYQKIGDGKLQWGDATILNNTEVFNKLAHNQTADVLNSIQDSQPYGNKYVVEPIALKLEALESVTAKNNPKAYEALVKNLNANGVKKDLKIGEISDVIPFKIAEEPSYKVRLTKTKDGYKFRVVGNGDEEINK